MQTTEYLTAYRPKLMMAFALVMASSTCAFAQATPSQQASVKQYFLSGSEPTIKDATWTSPHMFKVGVLNNGTKRDGFADYVCSVLNDRGLRGRGISVQVIDIATLVRTDKWVKLGESRCP